MIRKVNVAPTGGDDRNRWQLQDAKARFSELVRRAKSEGPQRVTVHGRDEVVVVSSTTFRQFAPTRTGQALVDALRAVCDHALEVEFESIRAPVRDVEL